MKKKYIIIIIIILGILITSLMVIFSFKLSDKKVLEKRSFYNKKVYIKNTKTGFQLIRNGKPFYIRGASGNSHFKELSEIGGNTIRIYDTTELKINLDKAQKAGLAVIVDIPIPKYNNDYDFYLDKDSTDKLIKNVKDFVNKYKNHPALLIWNLGNEINYPSVRYKRSILNYFNKSIYKSQNIFIEIFNKLIDTIHQIDINHPVSTTLLGSVRLQNNNSLFMNSPEIDLISYNTFGLINKFDSLKSGKNFFITEKPYFISEWGSDGYWGFVGECELTPWDAPIEPTSTKKAEQITNRYKIITKISDGQCLGSLIFFWGEKNEVTPTWFSFFIGDYKSELIYTLENLWIQSDTAQKLIGIDYMLVNGKGARDSLIFTPGELLSAELVFHDYKKDSVRTEWELCPEDWHQNSYDKSFIPRQEKINSFVECAKNTATFRAPTEEGPYRVYAYIYDQSGYFATVNTPFYILSAK